MQVSDVWVCSQAARLGKKKSKEKKVKVGLGLTHASRPERLEGQPLNVNTNSRKSKTYRVAAT